MKMAKNKYKLIRTNEKFVSTTNLKEQSWKPEVFLRNESTEEKGFRKEITLTKNNRTNQRPKNEKEVNVTDYEQANHTQWGNAFEVGKIQQLNEFRDSGKMFSDEKNVFNAKNLLIKVEVDEECSVGDERTVKSEDNISCTTEHATNKDSVESSPKKYPSLSVTVSESVNRKVVVQPFHLDSIVFNPYLEFTTTENTDDDNKLKLKNKRYSSDLATGEPKNCDPLLKQLISSSKNVKNETTLENGGNEFEREYSKLYELIGKKEKGIVVKKEIKYSEFQSDAESDDELEKKHRNRRLQVERPVSVVKSGNWECRKPRENKLDQHQRNQKRKRCKSSYDHHKYKKLSEADESSYIPKVKRPKWPSDVTKNTDTRKTKQENLNNGKQANKSAEFWSEVLTTPKLWKTENNKIDIGKSHKGKLEMNYHELLNTYISCNSFRSQLDDECWETAFLEKFKDPSNMHYILDFYIPPAQVVLFKLTLTNESSSIECLRKVCENRSWPQPVYNLVPQSDNNTGFVYICELKSVQFSSVKPAFNHRLAQELAAYNCLDWLGLRLCL